MVYTKMRVSGDESDLVLLGLLWSLTRVGPGTCEVMEVALHGGIDVSGVTRTKLVRLFKTMEVYCRVWTTSCLQYRCQYECGHAQSSMTV